MRLTMLGAITVCICLGAASTAQSTKDAALETRLDKIVTSYTNGNAFMGTVLVADGDRIVLNKGYGMANLGWNIPNAPDVKFRLGSLTKQFTAALVLIMQEDGKLNIQDRVSKYLPDTPQAWGNITLAELLGHTAGIPNFPFVAGFDTWKMSAHSPEELLALFSDKPLDFEPGSKFEYSNSNYEVLGVVLEKVSGEKYGDLLQERIFKPLGMNDSGLDADELILSRFAQGYMQAKSGLVLARPGSMTVPWAAGSIYSTTGDLLKWEHGLFGGKLLSAATLKSMTTPGKGNYGFGVFIGNHDGLKVIGHSGAIEGFNSNLIYVPEGRIAVVVLSNVSGSAPSQMGSELLDTVLGKPVVLASEQKPMPIARDELMKFVGAYDLTARASLTIVMTDGGLTAQTTGDPVYPITYQGLKNGHPSFLDSAIGGTIEFIPDASGAITSLVLHWGGHDIPAKRH